MTLSLGSSLKVGDEVVFRDLDGEGVILHLGSGMYFGLDATGTRIWALIAEHGRLDSVLDLLCREYDAPADVIERDLLELAGVLLDKGLLVATSG